MNPVGIISLQWYILSSSSQPRAGIPDVTPFWAFCTISCGFSFRWQLKFSLLKKLYIIKLYISGWIYILELVSDGWKEEQIFAWILLTLPGKREVSTPWVSRAEHLTVLVRHGRHLLKVFSWNVNLRQQASFALYPKQRGHDDGNNADAATSTVIFSDAVTVHLGQIWADAFEDYQRIQTRHLP